MTDAERLRWQDLAACLDATNPEIFFPPRGGTTREAKLFCDGNTDPKKGPTRLPCPVRSACLRYALGNREQFGVWGGVASKKRRGAANEYGVEQREWRKQAS